MLRCVDLIELTVKKILTLNLLFNNLMQSILVSTKLCR